MTLAHHSQAPIRIGVFDSGLGGLSVLKAIRQQMPQAELLYVADSGHAPYGERDSHYVRERSAQVAAFLEEQACDVLVIACNTATAAAAQWLRVSYPSWPIVGVEPGIKPAAALSRAGRIGVMATEGTLQSEKFQLLALAHAAHVQLVLQPCPGLASAIEAGDLNSTQVLSLVHKYCTTLRGEGVDTVVLGCTHYPFVADHIQAAMGSDILLIDTADAVARRTLELSPASSRATDVEAGRCRVWTTGSVETLQQVCQSWLAFPCEVQHRLSQSTKPID